jgi:hypothetical protein
MDDLGGYITGKIAAGAGGLIGGFGVMTYIRPTNITEAFTRGGISTGSACIFAAPVLVLTGINPTWDMQIASGATIGFVAYFVLGAVANFFRRNEKSDIVEVVEQVKKIKKDKRNV